MCAIHYTISQLFDTNSLTGTVQILDKQPQELTRSDFGDQLIDAVIGEPYFFSSLLPWHNLHFWYATSALRDLLAPDCLFLPKHAFLKAIAGVHIKAAILPKSCHPYYVVYNSLSLSQL